MSTAKKPKLISQISVAAQIIDGSITIDSIEEFENILKVFPDDPALLRAYADYLAKNKLPDAAAMTYGDAARLFIESGKMLPALIAKSLQWKIIPPTHLEEARLFLANLKNSSYQQVALNDFFHRLSYPALLAILYRLAKFRLPPGKMVLKSGEEEKYLYLIVSGALRATVFQPLEKDQETVFRKVIFNLSESDFFGSIFPFTETKISQSYVETISQVELVKISKQHLMQICQKYPAVEAAIKDLYNPKQQPASNNASPSRRKGQRHALAVEVSLQISPPGAGRQPTTLKGYSRDISIGGICVVLDAEAGSTGALIKSIDGAAIQVGLPSEEVTLYVTGSVIWRRETDTEAGNGVILGIQFNEMSPKLRGLLFVFAGSLCNPPNTT